MKSFGLETAETISYDSQTQKLVYHEEMKEQNSGENCSGAEGDASSTTATITSKKPSHPFSLSGGAYGN